MLEAPTRASQFKNQLRHYYRWILSFITDAFYIYDALYEDKALLQFKYIDVKVEALCAGYKVQEMLVTPSSKHQAAPHDCFSKSELLAPTAEVTTDH